MFRANGGHCWTRFALATRSDQTALRKQGQGPAAAAEAYASGVSYKAFGELGALVLGNGRHETTEYNGRQQQWWRGLGTAAGVSLFRKEELVYGADQRGSSWREARSGVDLGCLQIPAVWLCLVGIFVAGIAGFRHAVEWSERLIIGFGILAFLSEIWLRFFRRESVATIWRVGLRLITLSSLTYVGWFGSEPWFRSVEDSGLRDPLLVDSLNRRHLMRGALAYGLIGLVTTSALWLTSGGRRPTCRWAGTPVAQWTAVFVSAVLLSGGIAIVQMADESWFMFGLGFIGLELLILGAGIVAEKRAAFWVYVGQTALLLFVFKGVNPGSR